MKLDEIEVNEMVSLVGEVASLKGGQAVKKRFLMKRLCRLVKADSWVWALSCQRNPSESQMYVSIMKDGFTEESYARYLEAVEHPEMIAVASKFFVELTEKNTHLTRLRSQIADKDRIIRSGVEEAWKAADIGPTIMSLRPLDERSSSAVGLYRSHAREEFSLRELRITHIILAAVPWLHEQGWPEDRGVTVSALTKRQRLTLNYLMLGQSHKQIAESMKISVHTVQGYIKETYRHFGVHSQAELMSRFFNGNVEELT